MKTDSRIIVALDYASAKDAENFVAQIEPGLCKLKIGKELFAAAGPQLVRRLIDKKFDIFLDLKFHDIPNTVAKAVAAAADLGVWMTDVHASGGSRMMTAAREQLEKMRTEMRLIAVTVLTSMDEADLAEIGCTLSAEQQVLKLAQLAYHSGMHGVVSSAREVQLLRRELGKEFLLVTPGIRLRGQGNADDQRRVVEPAEALALGSNYLVIGRPITQAKNPLQALLDINAVMN